MAKVSSVWGVGTRFCGRYAVSGDGSYTTSKWFMIAAIPVIPLSCWRLTPAREEENHRMYSGDNAIFLQNNEDFFESERLPFRWPYFGKQCLSSLALVLWLIAAFPVFAQVLSFNQDQRILAFYVLMLGYYMILPAAIIVFVSVFFDRIWGSDHQ